MKKQNKKEKILLICRMVIFLVVIGLMVWVTIQSLPLIGKLSNEETRIEFKNEIADKGIVGSLIMLGLQVLQIVVAVIPGQPMEIISGMLYGTWGGMLLCIIGILIGTTLVFFLVRKMGEDFIHLFFSKEKVNEIKNSKMFKNPQKFEWLLFMMFAIPLIPKDIFIYVAGLSPVRPGRFLAIATFARIPGLFVTVYAGNKLSEGNFAIAVILVAAFLIIGVIGYFISDRTKKKVEVEEEQEQVSNNI